MEGVIGAAVGGFIALVIALIGTWNLKSQSEREDARRREERSFWLLQDSLRTMGMFLDSATELLADHDDLFEMRTGMRQQVDAQLVLDREDQHLREYRTLYYRTWTVINGFESAESIRTHMKIFADLYNGYRARFVSGTEVQGYAEAQLGVLSALNAVRRDYESLRASKSAGNR